MRLLSRLPLLFMQTVGAAMGHVVGWVSPAYRKRLANNLARAGFDTAAMRARALSQAGRSVGELPFVWFGPPARVLGRVVCDDMAVLEAAEQRGKGVIILTPHLGAFEVLAPFFGARAPFTAMFKPPRQAALQPVLQAARTRDNLHGAPTTVGGLRRLVRALRRGETIAILPDQVPTDGDGVWAPFFGEPAYTMTLPQRLVELTGASIVLTVAERLDRAAGWRIHMRPMPESPTPEAVNRAMESLIRAFPEQYLWTYNRYKRPRSARENA